MVALPKKWVKQMGLKQGAEIIITRHSAASLMITPDSDALPGDSLDATVEVSGSGTSMGINTLASR